MAKATASAGKSFELKSKVKAPPARVWKAWTTSAELAKWFNPTPSAGTKVSKLDVRVGGSYLIQMKSGRDNLKLKGTFKEVAADKKLVYSWSWGNPKHGENLVTVGFAEAGKGTEITVRQERIINAASLQEHKEGWKACLARLAALLDSKSSS